jgi:hypothetical protein
MMGERCFSTIKDQANRKRELVSLSVAQFRCGCDHFHYVGTRKLMPES